MNHFLLTAQRIGLAMCAVLVGIAGWCDGAPLVLRGMARVATVFDDFLYEGTVRSLPFTTHVGDNFSFLLNIPDQPNELSTFQANFGTVQLNHSQLEVLVQNDSEVSILTLAEPRIVDAAAIVGDGIHIRKLHRFGETDFVGTTTSLNAPGFQLELGFLEAVLMILPRGSMQNYPTVLNSSSIPRSASIWQAFTDREIAIEFQNLSFVGAYIDTFSVVPEPSTIAIFSCLTSLLLGRQFTGRKPGVITLKWPRSIYVQPYLASHRYLVGKRFRAKESPHA